jgi:hypothetical protein
VAICGIDSIKILDQALKAAKTFKPFSAAQLNMLLARTEKAAMKGKLEPFKTSSVYDSTASNPEWLGEEPQELQALTEP